MTRKNSQKHICVDCAALLKRTGYKVSDVKGWSTKRVKCAHCGKTRHASGLLEDLKYNTEAEEEEHGTVDRMG